jgi:hypothetical protein
VERWSWSWDLVVFGGQKIHNTLLEYHTLSIERLNVKKPLANHSALRGEEVPPHYLGLLALCCEAGRYQGLDFTFS